MMNLIFFFFFLLLTKIVIPLIEQYDDEVKTYVLKIKYILFYKIFAVFVHQHILHTDIIPCVNVSGTSLY